MTKQFLALLAATGVLLVTASSALPQSTDMPTEEDADVAVQPVAIKALDDMAANLRTLKEFRLTATTTQDDVLDDGEKLEIAGHSVYEVRVPDRLKLETVTDQQARTYFYDGKTVTQYAPRLDYYSVFEAPPTIAETIVAAPATSQTAPLVIRYSLTPNFGVSGFQS